MTSRLYKKDGDSVVKITQAYQNGRLITQTRSSFEDEVETVIVVAHYHYDVYGRLTQIEYVDGAGVAIDNFNYNWTVNCPEPNSGPNRCRIEAVWFLAL